MTTIQALLKQTWEDWKVGFAQAVGELAVGLRGFQNFFQAVWNAIQQGFANVIAQMVVKFIAGLAKMKAAQAALGFLGGIFGGIFGFLGHLLGLQHGGLVTRPTLAMVGEGGPEAVIPLNRLGAGLWGSGGPGPTIIFQGPSFLDDISTWKMSRTIRQELQRDTRRQRPSIGSLITTRPAAQSVGGSAPGQTSYRKLSR
jgi:hypothetical protein